jgi:hypothetical protein
MFSKVTNGLTFKEVSWIADLPQQYFLVCPGYQFFCLINQIFFNSSIIFISVPAGQGGKKGSSLTLGDRVSVYLELAGAHSQLNHGVSGIVIVVTKDSCSDVNVTTVYCRCLCRSFTNTSLFLHIARGRQNNAGRYERIFWDFGRSKVSDKF